MCIPWPPSTMKSLLPLPPSLPPSVPPSLLPSRFIRSKLPQEQSEREAAPKGQNITHMLYGTKQLRDAYCSITILYEKFVGAIHFKTLSSFLGYQGMAMLLEQLLNVVSNTVSVCVCVCVRYYVLLSYF